MSNFKSIRARLGVTQAALAAGMGCTQGNVSFYEKGQTILPDAAKRLIDYAATLGHSLSFNDIYGEGEINVVTTDSSEPIEADAPLTADPALAAELAKAEQAGLVLLPKKTAPWDGLERRAAPAEKLSGRGVA